MLGIKNRGSLPAITEDEFDHIIAQFRGLFLVEHNEDGTHLTRDRELDYIPIGAMQGWLHATPPIGWIMLDGSQKNRLTYQALFNLWGTTYGVGDGSTTFNVPDLRGYFFFGKAAAGTGSTLGGTFGSLDHTHSGGSHTHSITSGGAHTHTTGAHTHGAGSYAAASHDHGIDTEGTHTHGAGSYGADSGGSHQHNGTTGVNNINDAAYQVGATVGFALEGHTHDFDTNAGGTHTHTVSGTSSAGGSHDHGGSTASNTAAVSGTSASGGSGATTSSDGAHDHGAVTGSASGTTGTGNPPGFAGYWIAFAGVA